MQTHICKGQIVSGVYKNTTSQLPKESLARVRKEKLKHADFLWAGHKC